MSEMLNKIQHLANSREEVETAKEKIKQLREKMEEEFQKSNKDLLEDFKQKSDLILELSKEIREAAITQFEQTGNKKPFPGIGIKVNTELQFEVDQALEWAKTHQLALQLDTKAFEKIVRATPEHFKFVTIKEVPMSTIATDLSKALKDEIT